MIMEYQEVGGVMIPNLSHPQERPAELGPFAAKRLSHLKKNKPVLYSDLLTTGQLEAHLAETEASAQRMMEALADRTAKAQGIDEALKRDRPMEWVRAMGEIQATATGTVMREIVLA